MKIVAFSKTLLLTLTLLVSHAYAADESSKPFEPKDNVRYSDSNSGLSFKLDRVTEIKSKYWREDDFMQEQRLRNALLRVNLFMENQPLGLPIEDGMNTIREFVSGHVAGNQVQAFVRNNKDALIYAGHVLNDFVSFLSPTHYQSEADFRGIRTQLPYPQLYLARVLYGERTLMYMLVAISPDGSRQFHLPPLRSVRDLFFQDQHLMREFDDPIFLRRDLRLRLFEFVMATLRTPFVTLRPGQSSDSYIREIQDLGFDETEANTDPFEMHFAEGHTPTQVYTATTENLEETMFHHLSGIRSQIQTQSGSNIQAGSYVNGRNSVYLILLAFLMYNAYSGTFSGSY